MATVNIDDAGTRLAQLVDQAAADADVVVGRNGKPPARSCGQPPDRRS